MIEPLPVGDHHAAGVLHRQEGADQVHPQDLGPVVGGLLVQRRPAAGDAGVGPDHVEAAELGLGAVDVGFDEGFVAGVALQRHGLAAGLGDHRGGLLDAVGAVDADHGGAFAGEEQGGGAADAAAGAGDDGRAAGETSHEAWSLGGGFGAAGRGGDGVDEGVVEAGRQVVAHAGDDPQLRARNGGGRGLAADLGISSGSSAPCSTTTGSFRPLSAAVRSPSARTAAIWRATPGGLKARLYSAITRVAVLFVRPRISRAADGDRVGHAVPRRRPRSRPWGPAAAG